MEPGGAQCSAAIALSKVRHAKGKVQSVSLCVCVCGRSDSVGSDGSPVFLQQAGSPRNHVMEAVKWHHFACLPRPRPSVGNAPSGRSSASPRHTLRVVQRWSTQTRLHVLALNLHDAQPG